MEVTDVDGYRVEERPVEVPPWAGVPAPPAQPARRRAGPRWWWYAFAVVLILAGAVSLGLGVRGLSGFPDELTRVAAPGQSHLTLDPGDYVIFYEYRSVVNGEVVNGPEQPPGMTTAMVAADTRTPVQLRSPSGETSYAVGGRAGRSIAEFTIDRPGDYVIASRYDAGEGPSLVLGVGHDPLRSIVAEFLIGIVGLIVGVTVLIVSVVVAIVRRQRARPLPR
jgi:hypothetical protein